MFLVGVPVGSSYHDPKRPSLTFVWPSLITLPLRSVISDVEGDHDWEKNGPFVWFFSLLLKTQTLPWISHVFLSWYNQSKGSKPGFNSFRTPGRPPKTPISIICYVMLYMFYVYIENHKTSGTTAFLPKAIITMKITSLGTLQLRLQISASSLICWSLFAFFLRNGGGKWEISSRCKVTGESVSECMWIIFIPCLPQCNIWIIDVPPPQDSSGK